MLFLFRFLIGYGFALCLLTRYNVCLLSHWFFDVWRVVILFSFTTFKGMTCYCAKRHICLALRVWLCANAVGCDGGKVGGTRL